MRAPGRFRRWMFPLLLTAALVPLGGGTARGAESGTCYVATIQEPFAVGDGVVHPAGQLRICESRSLSPVESLHVVSVDGMPEGAFRFRVATASDRRLADGGAVFLFVRESGELRLEGYASRRGATERMLLLQPAPAGLGSPLVLAARLGR